MNNRVELLDYMGSDKSHSLSAWASTFYDLELPLPKDVKIRVDQIVDYIMSKSKRMRSIEDLLQYLANENHESPFRMSSFMFGMTTDVATHIQKLKHAVVLEAENAESAKYKELKEDKFYMPEDWLNVKNTMVIDDFCGYDYEWIEPEESTWFHILKKHTEIGNSLYHKSLKDLRIKLGDKRAKETARYFKTYNSQINSVNKFSFAGVITFAQKRTVDFAQEEIKQVALGMVDAIKNIEGNPFKHSLKAFGYE